MMNKKYLMKGFAALALVAGFSSCVKDVAGITPAQEAEQAKENAELQLGITIPTGQTWDMASQVTANVTVNGDYGAKYTATIYENNPLLTGKGVVLGKAEVNSGSSATFDFTCPNAAEILFAAIKDEKGYTYVKPVAVENGKVDAVFGENGASSRSMRTATNSNVNIPTGTPRATIENLAAAILAKSVELSSGNNGWNGNNFHTVNANYKQDESTNWQQVLQGYYVNYNNDYVVNYKISTDYSGLVNYLPSVGLEATGEYTNESDPNNLVSTNWTGYRPVYNLTARTVYIDNGATWTIPSGQEQRCGQGYKENLVDGIIIVGNGGELKVEGTLNFANLARLIVLPGGKVTGTGTINVTNGNVAGEEGYNFGTISVGKFNQNFGTFFNYGTFNGTELNGGAGTSTFVNQGHMYISGAPKGSNSANLQIKNNCWFEATGEVAGKLIENGAGAYFKAGALDLSSAEGGEGIGTYIASDVNSKMIITGAVKLQATLLYGPTSGNPAYLEFDNINYLNVGETYPITGYHNIYVGDFTGNNPTGYETSWETNLAESDGKSQMVGKKAFNTAATEASDCSPAFTPDPDPDPIYEELKVYTYAFEDQTVGSDYDMNDVVLKVNYHVTDINEETGEVVYDKTKLDAKLVAAGATYNIKIKIGDTYLFDGKEIHEALGVNAGVMVNTGNGKAQTKAPVSDPGVAIPSGWQGDFNLLPVTIEVTSTGKSYSYPNTDNYPHAVMIPVDWRWPLERIIVTEAYKGKEKTSVDPEKEGQNVGKITLDNGKEVFENSFEAWAATPAAYRTLDMKDWYNNPDKSKTMTNTSPATTE